MSRETATREPRAWRGRLAAWRDMHLYSLLSSLGRLAQRPVATLLTVGVLAVAVALPLVVAVLLGNVAQLAGGWQDSREVAVFLQPGTGLDAARQLQAQWRERADVEAVQLRTPEQGLAELRELSELGEALRVIGENPLPPVLLLLPRGTPERIDTLLATLRAHPQVDAVQHDALWRQRLDGWLALAARATVLLAALLALGLLLVVGNTVRLDIQGRAEEILTVQLLGATDGFVRRPFLYLGAWYGGLAGVLAWTLLAAVLALLQTPVDALAQQYGSGFRLQGLPFADGLRTVAVAIALGWGGAWLASSRHLARGRPQA